MKCTKLVTRVLGPGFRKQVLHDLGNGKFSLLIDESTDVSTLPMLCLVLRYVSMKERQVVTTFYRWAVWSVSDECQTENLLFRLVRLDGKNAEQITAAILAALKEDGLNVENMVGLGTDGANVLTGHRTGVITRLQEHNPELLLVRCVCHSLHKAAEHAFSVLPCHLETIVREVYGYFRLSSSRKDRYANVRNFTLRLVSVFLLSLPFSVVLGYSWRSSKEIAQIAWGSMVIALSMRRCSSQAVGLIVWLRFSKLNKSRAIMKPGIVLAWCTRCWQILKTG